MKARPTAEAVIDNPDQILASLRRIAETNPARITVAEFGGILTELIAIIEAGQRFVATGFHLGLVDQSISALRQNREQCLGDTSVRIAASEIPSLWPGTTIEILVQNFEQYQKLLKSRTSHNRTEALMEQCDQATSVQLLQQLALEVRAFLGEVLAEEGARAPSGVAQLHNDLEPVATSGCEEDQDTIDDWQLRIGRVLQVLSLRYSLSATLQKR